MIAGLKASIPYIVKCLSETNVEVDWLKDKILAFIKILYDCGFLVRMVVCDNHSSNVSFFKKLHAAFGNDNDAIYAIIDMKKISFLYYSSNEKH